MVTFLMVLIIPNTQNRDPAARHVKLDAIMLELKASNAKLYDAENEGCEETTDEYPETLMCAVLRGPLQAVLVGGIGWMRRWSMGQSFSSSRAVLGFRESGFAKRGGPVAPPQSQQQTDAPCSQASRNRRSAARTRRLQRLWHSHP
ncbi:low affinity iron permease family protein [Arthrobacter sp. efr-133-TYG-104]|uniref:low affinity iron permease family protein n=1 Tax=Arthrobacter sp. efr-133-TYG-104 TaxID=3040324 RepID=UPI0033061F64